MKLRKLTKQLLEKAKESFLLSIELYDKPTIKYRIESFAILFTNAWELLLKAKLYEGNQGKKSSIFRPKQPKRKRESITIDECLRKIFPDENNATRKNIEYISELRNESTHLIISDFNPYYSRAFQSGVINFINKTQEWFNLGSTDYLPVGFLTLITGEQFPDMEKIRHKYSKEDFGYLVEWVQKFEDLQKLGDEGAISVRHTVAIVKDPKNADYVVRIDNSGNTALSIIKTQQNIDLAYPYSTKEFVVKVNELIKGSGFITDYIFYSYAYVRNIKQTNNEYHFKSRLGTHQYSDKLALEMSTAIKEDNTSISNWTERYRKHLQSKTRH